MEIGVLNGEGSGDDFCQWLDVSSDGGVIALGAMTCIFRSVRYQKIRWRDDNQHFFWAG